MKFLEQYESCETIWNDYEKLKEAIFQTAVKKNKFQKELTNCNDDLENLRIKIRDLEIYLNACEKLGMGLTARIIELEEGGKK